MDSSHIYAHIANQHAQRGPAYHEEDVLLCFGCMLYLKTAGLSLRFSGPRNFRPPDALACREEVTQALRQFAPSLSNILSAYTPFSPDGQEERRIWDTAAGLFQHLEQQGRLASGSDILLSFRELLYALAESSQQLAEYTPPRDIAVLVSWLVQSCALPKEEAAILDPSCGTGSLLVHAVQGASPAKAHVTGFTGNRKIADIASVYLALAGKTVDFHIHTGPEKPLPAGADLVLSLIPFGQREESRRLQDMLDAAAPHAAVVAVIPNGVLFRSGRDNAFRKTLLGENLLDTLVYLPEHLLYTTRIPVSILVLKKNRAAGMPVRMLDLCRGETSGRKRSQLSRQLLAAAKRDIFAEAPDWAQARLVPNSEIEENGCVLNRERYFPQVRADSPEGAPQISLEYIQQLQADLNRIQGRLEDYYRLWDGP